MKIRTVKMIDCSEWDGLVQETYGRPYKFQQQDGCQDRGIFHFSVPDESYEDEMNDSVPEVVNGDEMGVKFDVWLSRDPKQPLKGGPADDEFRLELWWDRTFYPNFQTVANDLYEKGLLDGGDYVIEIDW